MPELLGRLEFSLPLIGVKTHDRKVRTYERVCFTDGSLQAAFSPLFITWSVFILSP